MVVRLSVEQEAVMDCTSGRASQRGADGGGDGAGAGFSTTSEAAAFRSQFRMVGRADAGQGARPGDAVVDPAWTNRSLDRRRYVVSQERPAFGRCASSVLRTTRQAGQLPGGGDAVDRQSS